MAKARVLDQEALEDNTTDPNAVFMKERFEVELEFLQCLANPWYINIIAQQGYFDKPEFINYLNYLQYWKKPEYVKFVVYPHALAFLDLLQTKEFREEIKKVDEATRIHGLQYHHWRWPNYQQTDKESYEQESQPHASQAEAQ
ncbi:suppressor of hpr1 [Coemansia asiatica]|uniref:Mediator of RNA polymerase II transcription subunit 31 n=1 Tax=Coemansia asiatica TaxID=1052880 RepID=A0A9W8CK14_9FUNG|nr:suppressor of hpr1 [Coemansia asiatica]